MMGDDDGGVDPDSSNDGDEKYAKQGHALAPETGAVS
jgi:hypothetical protein